MKYTLQQLFDVINEKKQIDEFYYVISGGGFGADYYLDRITSYAPDGKIIVASDCNEKELEDKNIKFQQVEVDGLLLFEYVSHTEEFTLSRLESYDEVSDIIYGNKGVLNMFSGDIILLENGRRKKLYVKDIHGTLLKWSDIERINNQGDKIFAEWR